MKYSEEEKKAIEELRYWRDYNIKHNTPIPAFIIANVGKVLNLIEKQQKEIESIKENIIDTINDLEELQDNEYDGMVQDFIDTLKDLF